MYSKAKLAAACAGIVYFLSYVPYMYVAIREEAAGDEIPAWAKSIGVSISDVYVYFWRGERHSAHGKTTLMETANTY